MNYQPSDLVPEFDLEGLQETEIVETQEKGAVETPEEKIEQPIVYDESADANAVTFYDALKERGFVEADKDFKGTWEEVDKYIENLPQKVLDTVVEQSPDITKQVLKFVFASDKSIDKVELKSFMDTYLNELDSTEIVTLDAAREFLQKQYEKQGMRPSAIRAQLDELEDDEKLLDEAKAEQAKTTKKSDDLIRSKQEQTDEFKSKQLAFVQSVNDEIKATGWQASKQHEIVQMFRTNKITNQLQDIFKNPKAFVQLANIVSMFDGKEIKLDGIIKQEEGKITNGVKNAFEKALSSIPTTQASTKSPGRINLDNLSPDI